MANRLLQIMVALVAGPCLWWLSWQHAGLLQTLVAAIAPIAFLILSAKAEPYFSLAVNAKVIIGLVGSTRKRLNQFAILLGLPTYASLLMPPVSNIHQLELANALLIFMSAWLLLTTRPSPLEL